MLNANLLASVLYMVRQLGLIISCSPFSSLLTLQLFCLVGDSLNSSLVAIVSVDQDVLKAWAASEGIKVIYFLLFYIAAKSRIIFVRAIFLLF